MINCTTSKVIKAITRAKPTNYFPMLHVIHPVSYFISPNYLRYKDKSSPIFQMSQTGHIRRGGSLTSEPLSESLHYAASTNKSQKGSLFTPPSVI